MILVALILRDDEEEEEENSLLELPPKVCGRKAILLRYHDGLAFFRRTSDLNNLLIPDRLVPASPIFSSLIEF